MYGIYIEATQASNYPVWLAKGIKEIETRTRDVFKSMPKGEKVAIISTRKGREPYIIGFCHLSDGFRITADLWDDFRSLTMVPEGSKFDIGNKPFKYGYWASNVEYTGPIHLPKRRVNHGRSWCEFNMLFEAGEMA